MNILIVTYILNFIIIFITLYLIFLLIKSRSFKIYPCYNITILSFIIFFDNILRIIPWNNIIEYPQAFLLTSLDKLLLTTITSQAIITFLGVCLTKIYFANEKKIFLTTLIAGISISCILSLLYILIAKNRTHVYSIYAYCEDSFIKRITDTIFNAIFLLINLFCTLALLIYITKKRRQASLGIIEDLDYGHHHTKIVFMFLFNSLLFIESYLIIYDKFPGNEVDLIYLISCLLILFYYTINKIIIKETLKLFCKSFYESKYRSIKKNEYLTDDDDDDDDEEQKNEKKSNSFSDD